MVEKDVTQLPEVYPMEPISGPQDAVQSTVQHGWYALYVRSRREHFVAQQLEQKNLEVFLPFYVERHRWADRWKQVRMPLFAGYVFCRFNARCQSHALATSGVIDVLRTGNLPCPIAEDVIEDIRRATLQPGLARPYIGVVEGQRILLTEGPLKGLAGVVMKVQNSLRLLITVELLQRSVMIEVEPEWVAPARPSYTNSKVLSSAASPFSSSSI